MRIISRTVAIFGASISLLFLRDCVRQRESDKLMRGGGGVKGSWKREFREENYKEEGIEAKNAERRGN